MAQHTPVQVIQRYLQVAIAAEQNFEKQLRSFAKDSDYESARMLFEEHADETRRQCDRLTARLHALGGSPSGFQSFLAGLFAFGPKTAQMGFEDEEKTVQDLMAVYAVENSEIAMYECLCTAASAAGDTETYDLAREIQQEERRASQRVWDLIAPCARDAYEAVTTTGPAVRRAA